MLLEKVRIPWAVANLSKEYKVFGPVTRRSYVSFQEIPDGEGLNLEYTTTTLPPKKLFHHAETLLHYHKEDFSAPKLESDQHVLLFGVHPCDLNAIQRMDKFFSKDYIDSYYCRRRERSAIVALNCGVPDDKCFCASLGTGPDVKEGFDLLLTDLGEAYLVEVGTSKGKTMVAKLGLKNASQTHFHEKARRLREASKKFKKQIRMEGLAKQAAENPNHEAWALIGDRGGLAGCFACLSCGNCSMVCPTCYCYEVAEIPDVSLKEGIRKRELDSCQLLEYALVALGQNFRPDRRYRTRHWMTCKFGGAGGQQNTSCVGCGRCIRSCPSHIDLTEVARSLWGE